MSSPTRDTGDNTSSTTQNQHSFSPTTYNPSFYTNNNIIKGRNMKVLSLLLSISIGTKCADAFTAPSFFHYSPEQIKGTGTSSRSTKMEMGFFDGISKAFGNEEVRVDLQDNFTKHTSLRLMSFSFSLSLM